MYGNIKIQTFQLTSNEQTSIIENVISLELGLYCSSHCRCTIAAAVIPGVLQPSPLKKSRAEIYEGRGVHRKTKNDHMDHFIALSGMKVGLITFLILGQDRAFCRWELIVENQLQGGVSFDDHCSTKRMKEAFEITCETKMTRIYDNQDIKRCTWLE
jgi:hypothetical protein